MPSKSEAWSAVCAEPKLRSVFSGLPEEQHELRLEWLPNCDKAAVEASHRSFNEKDIWSELASITHRSTLIYALEGKVVPDDDARDFAGRIPDCRCIAIPKVSHMMPWDDLDAFVAAVAQSLA